jgi:hypothetical protein
MSYPFTDLGFSVVVISSESEGLYFSITFKFVLHVCGIHTLLHIRNISIMTMCVDHLQVFLLYRE